MNPYRERFHELMNLRNKLLAKPKTTTNNLMLVLLTKQIIDMHDKAENYQARQILNMLKAS